MKMLIFGKNGQIAWELQRSLAVLGEVRALGSNEVNFLDKAAIVSAIKEYKPTHIVNASAYTAVDKAEQEEDVANKINGDAVGVIAEEAKRIEASFLHYSTDYVFDGSKTTAYVETDSAGPLNAYGRSKLLGEQNIQAVGGDYIVLRVSWVYGNHGQNFYRTMLRLGSEREELKIVSDQIGAPTWSRHIADASAHILKDRDISDKVGIYHLSPQGETSWYGFANKIFELHREAGLTPLKVKSLQEISTQEYVTPAKRPLNSRMKASKIFSAFGLMLPEWSQSLSMVVHSK